MLSGLDLLVGISIIGGGDLLDLEGCLQTFCHLTQLALFGNKIKNIISSVRLKIT